MEQIGVISNREIIQESVSNLIKLNRNRGEVVIEKIKN